MYNISFIDNFANFSGELWAVDKDSLCSLLAMLSSVPDSYGADEYSTPAWPELTGTYRWGTVHAEVVWIDGAQVTVDA